MLHEVLHVASLAKVLKLIQVLSTDRELVLSIAHSQIEMLPESGALCAGDNPLSGQHLRVVAMEV